MKIILTGATGFVGEGVLLESLKHPQVEEILLVNRKLFYLNHPKLKELLVADFMNLEPIKSELAGYDACFYCAGISSGGLDEAAYTKIILDTTLHFAKTLVEMNPDLTFNFVSGKSTDSTETGKVMWARIKGKAENALARLPFKKHYNFRPGFMKPIPGQKNVKTFYKLISSIWPLLFPKSSCLLQEVAHAMIHAVVKGYPKQTLEVTDIRTLANFKP